MTEAQMPHLSNIVELVQAIQETQELCHDIAVKGGWWYDIKTGEPIQRNFGELIALAHSELSEALEGFRKGETDKKLPHRLAVEVELADTVIRIFDTAEGFGLDIAGALFEKLEYNIERQDHKPENRAQEGGKKF